MMHLQKSNRKLDRPWGRWFLNLIDIRSSHLCSLQVFECGAVNKFFEVVVQSLLNICLYGVCSLILTKLNHTQIKCKYSIKKCDWTTTPTHLVVGGVWLGVDLTTCVKNACIKSRWTTCSIVNKIVSLFFCGRGDMRKNILTFITNHMNSQNDEENGYMHNLDSQSNPYAIISCFISYEKWVHN